MQPVDLINQLKKQNFYDRLKVSKEASRRDISQSYNTLILQWHPDKHLAKGREFVDQCQVIVSLYNEAYTTLSNSNKKSAYDDQLGSSLDGDQEELSQKIDTRAALDADNSFRMAGQLLERGQMERARTLLRQTIEGNPGHKEAQMLLEYVSAMLSLDNKRQATTCAEKILQMTGGGIKKDEQKYLAGSIYFSLKEYVPAERILKEALQLNPNHKKARSQLNLIKQRKGATASGLIDKLKNLFGQ